MTCGAGSKWHQQARRLPAPSPSLLFVCPHGSNLVPLHAARLPLHPGTDLPPAVHGKPQILSGGVTVLTPWPPGHGGDALAASIRAGEVSEA